MTNICIYCSSKVNKLRLKMFVVLKRTVFVYLPTKATATKQRNGTRSHSEQRYHCIAQYSTALHSIA